MTVQYHIGQALKPNTQEITLREWNIPFIMLPDLHTLMQNSRFVQNHSWKSQDINQRYSWTGQLHTSGCQEAELPPDLAPPPSPLLPHASLNSDTTIPPPAPHIPRTFHSPPPLTNCDPHQSLCAALDWSLPHPALTANYLFLTVWLKTDSILWALVTLTDW